MDNLESRDPARELSLWVRACADLLTPPAGWEPNLKTARARFEARAGDRLRRRFRLKRYLLAGAMAALIACIVVPTVPRTRVFAQQIGSSGWQRLEQLWYWITIVRRGPFMMGRLPDTLMALHAERLPKSDRPQAVSTVAEAAHRAGFSPRLPDAGFLTEPRLSVMEPVSFVAVLRADDLVEALRAAGARDQQVPRHWDGTQLTLQVGPTVTARWLDVSAWSDFTLTQGQAKVLTAPAGFDLEAFGAVGLRAAGMRNPEMVVRLARLATTAPALLFGYRTPYYYAGAREVDLRSGPATLIEEFGLASANDRFGYSDGVPRVERLTLLWSMPDRVYVLSGVPKIPPAMISAGLAAALAGAIDLANSIE